MGHLRDPFTILESANPITEEQLREVSASTAMQEALDDHLATPARPRSRWTAGRLVPRPVVGRRRPALALIALAVVGLGWTVYVAQNSPTKPLTVGCYAAADLHSRTEV